MKVRVHDLIFEVTRKCNMQCDHCLRGHAENKDLTKEIVDKVLDQIDCIDCLNFTGGEVTLNVEIIRYIIDQIIERKIEVYDFFIATNGKIYSDELINAILDLYAYRADTWNCDDNECCSLVLSKDEFHEPISKIHEAKLRSFVFFKDFKIRTYNGIGIISKGLALENGIGTRISSIDECSCEVYDENKIYETLYINVNGDIFFDCDMSYDEQRELQEFNVFVNDLYDLYQEELTDINSLTQEKLIS